MKHEKKLTKKPRNTARTSKMRTKLLQGIADGMNVSEAGRQAGYSYPQAAHLALKGMQLQLQEILEHMDLPIEKVLKAVLVPGLQAERTEFFSMGGVVIDKRKVVDHEQRGKFFDRYCKLLGLYGSGHDTGAERENQSGPRYVSITLVNISPGAAAAIMASNPRSSGDHQQLDLDATPHEDSGRPGPDPEL